MSNIWTLQTKCPVNIKTRVILYCGWIMTSLSKLKSTEQVVAESLSSSIDQWKDFCRDRERERERERESWQQ
ncbi:hypothetical protein AQUCO_00200546v1 [Aquilegia coerulea]|uniref:Uncharacterized protein n=1 Tax=Aquilegia coerulea TaxID=218851 RepID=A0A2G5F3M5_AQUCA|nr:hypothetical protein AQUCO_00200546v1 [Aquilegia coerulea]